MIFCQFLRQVKILRLFAIFSLLYFFYFIANGTIFGEFYRIIDIKEKPNCSILFHRDADFAVVQKAEQWTYPANESNSDEQLTKKIKENCSKFLSGNQYFLTTDDDDEREFSLAFSIVVFKSATQVERLLRSIYRPWNYYCFHVDAKADSRFYDAIAALTTCLGHRFGNIINTRDQVSVEWGKMSVLTADLNCMRELYQRYKTWKYIINLTGQEFPLKTNRQLVYILKAFNGANVIEGTYQRRNEERITLVAPPFPLIWYKGAVHITANRDFVKFIFESPKSEIILNALEYAKFADEQFFATLNFNPQLRIRGSYVGDPDEQAAPNQPNLYFLTRLKNWGDYPCLSQRIVRNICIWGVSDLPQLVDAKHLFANKFHEDFQPATLRCLEEWYYDKVRKETADGGVNIDIPFYKSMLFVINQFQPFRLNRSSCC